MKNIADILATLLRFKEYLTICNSRTVEMFTETWLITWKKHRIIGNYCDYLDSESSGLRVASKS